MCLLTVFTPDAEFDTLRMSTAADNNPDGFGFAMLLDGHIARFRSMSYNETADEFQRLRGLYPDTWAMFHHRFSTGGGETVENCHPFSWAHDERVAIGHNGILPIQPGRRKSDTRIWAENHLGNLHPTVLDSENWFGKTETWLGSSKAVVLSAHPDNVYGLYILNEHFGHWEDGVWWSNDSYRSYRYRTDSRVVMSGVTDRYSSDKYDAADIVSCSYCGSTWEMDDEYYNTDCDTCGTCWICEENSADCMCWGHSDYRRNAERELDFGFDSNMKAIAAASLNSGKDK
jgi:predicted glutamine amidotransferase